MALAHAASPVLDRSVNKRRNLKGLDDGFPPDDFISGPETQFKKYRCVFHVMGATVWHR